MRKLLPYKLIVLKIRKRYLSIHVYVKVMKNKWNIKFAIIVKILLNKIEF